MTKYRLKWKVMQCVPYLHDINAEINPNGLTDTDFSDLWLGKTKLATVKIMQYPNEKPKMYCVWLAALGTINEIGAKAYRFEMNKYPEAKTVEEFKDIIEDICQRYLQDE
jgi:hypothetical protein